MPALSAEVGLAWIYLGGISPAPSKYAIIARSIEKQVVAPPAAGWRFVCLDRAGDEWSLDTCLDEFNR